MLPQSIFDSKIMLIQGFWPAIMAMTFFKFEMIFILINISNIAI